MLTQLHAIKHLIPSDSTYYATGLENDHKYVIYCQSDLERYGWQFRQAGNNECHRISILWEAEDHSITYYHFELKKTADVQTVVGLLSQDEKAVYTIDPAKRYCYQQAMRYFEVLEQTIFKLNSDYETGKR